MNSATPPTVFKAFLEEALRDGWISGYSWAIQNEPLSASEKPRKSRSNKRDSEGNLWSLELTQGHSAPSGIGVDFESLLGGKILEGDEWIRRQFELDLGASREEVLVEFCLREASYKAVFPENEGYQLSDLRRSHGGYALCDRLTELRTQVRKADGWVIALARLL